MKMIEDNRLLDRQRGIDAERRAQAILRNNHTTPAHPVAAAMAKIANAPVASTPTYGHCGSCGAIEVRLSRVLGFRDYSAIGESARYPWGVGCELCS